MSKTIKIQIIGNYKDYKKGQILDLEEKQAVFLLTNGKAIKIHRQVHVLKDQTTETSEEKLQQKDQDKTNKKSKKNDQ